MEDLGLWRCDIETDADKHYGFLTVLCPWLMQDPEVQESVVTGKSVIIGSVVQNQTSRFIEHEKCLGCVWSSAVWEIESSRGFFLVDICRYF